MKLSITKNIREYFANFHYYERTFYEENLDPIIKLLLYDHRINSSSKFDIDESFVYSTALLQL